MMKIIFVIVLSMMVSQSFASISCGDSFSNQPIYPRILEKIGADSSRKLLSSQVDDAFTVYFELTAHSNGSGKEIKELAAEAFQKSLKISRDLNSKKFPEEQIEELSIETTIGVYTFRITIKNKEQRDAVLSVILDNIDLLERIYPN